MSLTRDRFKYDAETDTFVCQIGRVLRLQGIINNKQRRRYRCDSCKGCPTPCFKNKGAKRKYLHVHVDEEIFERMIKKCDTVFGRWMQRKRGSTVEPVFGDIKRNKGFRQFLVRGSKFVDNLWKFTLAAHNLQKLVAIRMQEAV
jgi:transposase